MEILTYSPKVEVYAAVTSGGDTAYYDLSRDVVSCSVKRELNKAASFSVKLQNKGGKYDGVFTPMDRVAIYATGADGVRHGQLTGYITSVPSFRLFSADYTISGYCPLYRLQELYWDPSLYASQCVLGKEGHADDWSTVVERLLVNVAGMDKSDIYIGDVPEDAVNFAYELYAAQKADIQDAETLVEDFYNVVNTSGPKFTSSAGSSSGGATTSGTLGSGEVIEIPDSLEQSGIIGDYTPLDTISWCSTQAEVYNMWVSAGKPYSNGIATLDGRYLIAMRERFGVVGDKVDILLEDGTVINCTLMDIKGSDAEEWGHMFGTGYSLVEFEATYGFATSDVPENWAYKKVKSVTNCGSIF